MFERSSRPTDLHLGSLSSRLPSDHLLATELRTALVEMSRNLFEEYSSYFSASLREFDRAVYEHARRVQYAPEDWWRDLHDIVVTWSMQTICNQDGNGNAGSPEPWLVTAALLHDRGYAVLAAASTQDGAEYGEARARGGAHWEGADTRILHAKLSAELANELLFGSPAARIELPSAREQLTGAHQPPRDALLRVIETHDYPYVGRYEEMSLQAKHHFDADATYSLSLSSFVKDYLSYLHDAKRAAAADGLGLTDNGAFTPRSLLLARLAAHLSSADMLPAGWDQNLFPLLPHATALTNEGRCIPPHSEAALTLKQRMFLDLADCCLMFRVETSLAPFVDWLSDRMRSQLEWLDACRSANSAR